MLMANDDEETFNKEINLENYKYDDNIDIDGVDENKLLFLGHF